MSKYKLHPISAVIDGFKSLRGMILPFIIIIVANGFNINMDIRDERFWGEMVPFFILVIVVIFTFIHGIVKWITFRYWFEDSELRIQYGLFIKKNRFIPFDRIQSLNYKEGILHRILGLVQVSVETAGGTSSAAEAELTAITKEAANRIEKEMYAAKRGTVVDEIDLLVEPELQVIHKMSPMELVILATTSGGVGVILFGVATVITQFVEYIPFDRFAGELEYFVKYSFLFITILVIMGLIAAWLISVALTMLNYYDFKVSVENEKLIITRGLLEKKRVTIPLNRVQAIEITENPIRQIFGLATVTLETAGGGFAEKGEFNNSVKLFPLILKKDLIEPLKMVFPQFEFDFDHKVKKSPPRARPFFYRLDFFWWIPIVGFVSYFAFPYGLLSLLTIFPVIILGVWRHRTAAFIHSNSQIVIVSRLFSKITFIAEKKRIQSLEMRQSIFQKQRKIASLKVSVMSGISGATSIASHMDEKDINACLNWYEHNKEHKETN